MVAAAGRIEAVPLAIGLPLLAFVIVCFGALVSLRQVTSFYRLMPVNLPPAVLEDRARQVLDRFGYRDVPVDTVGELFQDGDYLPWARKQPEATRWNTLATGRAPAVGYWYRTGPRFLVPRGDWLSVSPSDPPLQTVGMTYVEVDAQGALTQFHAVPPQQTTGAAAPVAPDWQPVFDVTRWPRERFTPATPEWTPLVAVDTRAAWTGTLPELGSTPLRLEVGAFRGKIVYVQAVGPWTRPSRVPGPGVHGLARALDTFKVVLVACLIVGSALLARRMVVLGRGDWRGATTVAVALFVFGLAQWVALSHHVPDYEIEQNKFFDACADLLFRSSIAWLAYLGIEPWIRRHWPSSLISWSRLIGGAFRDPLVGRDFLIGAAFGDASAIYPGLIEYAFYAFGGNALDPSFTGIWALTAPRFVAASLLNGITNAIFNTLLITLLYVVCYRRLRKAWLAALLSTVVLTLVITAEDGFGSGAIGFLLIASISALIIAPLHFHGMLPFMAAFCVRQILMANALTADLGAWYSTPTWVMGAALMVLTVAAFLNSRAGAPTFGRLLEE
jgi:hypothetical protein